MRIAPRPIHVISRVVGGMIVLSLAAGAQLTKSADDSMASAAALSGSILQVRDRFSEPTATPDSRHLGPITGAATATRSPSLGDFESIPRLATPTPTSGLRDLETIFRSATSSPTPGPRDLEPIFRLAPPSATPGSRDLDPILRLPTATPGGRGTTPLEGPSTSPPVGMPLSSEPTPSSGLQNLGSDVLFVSPFEPRLSVYGEQAVFSWGASSGAALTVNYGLTQALEWTTTGQPSGTGPLVVHRAVLDRLQTDRPYYYRATIAQGGQVLSQTPIASFRTPEVVVRVRPNRIHMSKDGDSDVWFVTNKGEVYIEWRVRVSPGPQGTWPPGQRVTGCYPGGGSIATNFPPIGQPDSPGGAGTPPSGDDTTFDPSTGAQTPTLHGDPRTWAPYGGCWAYSYDGAHSTNTAKVGSGGNVDLRPEAFPPLGWQLPGGLPGQPAPSSSGVPGPLLMPADGPESDDGPPGQPPPPPCGTVNPGTFALVSISVRGQEFDDLPLNDLRIINHDVRGSEWICLDLREREGDPVMVGVTAEDGHFKFTVWFEVALDYRLPAAGGPGAVPGAR